MFNHRFPFSLLTLLAALAAASCPLAGETKAAAIRGRQLWVHADHPIVTFAGTETRVKLIAKPVGFTSDSFSWSQVEDRINPLRTAGRATISGIGSTVEAQLPAPGVYQFRAAAEHGEGPVVGFAWVQVWDDRGPLSPGNALGTGPGIRPPTSVRYLPPPPLPFEHPRVLFSDDDWQEMNRRAKSGKVAGWGVQTIRQWVQETLDDPKSPTGKFADELAKWAQSGYRGKGPDLGPLEQDAVLSSEARGVFYSMLLDACYLTWLDHDPAQPIKYRPPATVQRGRRLAQLTAAAATLHFSAAWDRKNRKAINKDHPFAVRGLDEIGEPTSGPALCDLALAYDLIYDWMTEPERKAVRDFLTAVGYGRHFSSAGFTWHTAERVNLGHLHNGDFGNMNDQHVLVALAVEGEEDACSPEVRETFCRPPAKKRAERWVRPAATDDPAAWPTATVASVENLEREIRWLVDWFTTPWGFAANHLAYLGLSAKHVAPAALAFARRGENQFVTTHYYQLALNALHVLHPAEGVAKSSHGLGESSLGWWDHHDSVSFQQRGTMAIVWKYMYPEDPLIDYVWRAYLPTLDRDPLVAAMFGLDPIASRAAAELPYVAQMKSLPLTTFDPQRGIVVARSAWTDSAASLWFDCCGSDAYQGHMHAERNSFDFFALGRAWSIAPGYHCTISDLQATVLVKDPRYAKDPASQGFLGESPSSATQVPPLAGNFPTPPGRLVEVAEGPDQLWTLAVGDARWCYQYGYSGKREFDTGLTLKSFLYPGMLDVFKHRSPEYEKMFNEHLIVTQKDYNPMRSAVRSVMFVRGNHPYALIVDDYQKDDAKHDWRWSMNCGQGFAPGLDHRFVDAEGHGTYSSLKITAGAKVDEAILYHSPIDDERKPGQKGLPRLLVREVGPHAGGRHPPMVLESRPPGGKGPYLTYGFDNNHVEKVATKIPSNRLLIERRGVVRPDYVVMLFPYRTGEMPPETTWNDDRSSLSIDLGPEKDVITFDRSLSDHRTRLHFQRTLKSPR